MYNSLQSLPREGVKIHLMSEFCSNVFNYIITKLTVLIKVMKLTGWKVVFNLMSLIITEGSVF